MAIVILLLESFIDSSLPIIFFSLLILSGSGFWIVSFSELIKSSLVIFPFGPVPLIFSRSMFSFSAIFFATGVMFTPEVATLLSWGLSTFVSADFAVVSLFALLDTVLESSIVPKISPTFTVSPSCFEILWINPSEGATISRLTLSVSSSIITSPLVIISPSFFNQEATVASTVDSANSGTIISVSYTHLTLPTIYSV